MEQITNGFGNAVCSKRIASQWQCKFHLINGERKVSKHTTLDSSAMAVAYKLTTLSTMAKKKTKEMPKKYG